MADMLAKIAYLGVNQRLTNISVLSRHMESCFPPPVDCESNIHSILALIWSPPILLNPAKCFTASIVSC